MQCHWRLGHPGVGYRACYECASAKVRCSLALDENPSDGDAVGEGVGRAPTRSSSSRPSISPSRVSSDSVSSDSVGMQPTPQQLVRGAMRFGEAAREGIDQAVAEYWASVAAGSRPPQGRGRGRGRGV